VETKNIVGIAGSLRQESLNKSLLKFMSEEEYEGLNIHIESLEEIPLFNADLEEGGDPAPVAIWKQKLKKADGILIVTPEYSQGTPGVLKNALDWAGSMTNENVLYHKPVMLAGATPTRMGTGFSQAQLRQTLAACDAYPLQQPQVFIPQAHKIIEKGKVSDEKTAHFLKEAAASFLDWIVQLEK
jgi:chromate reductase, NAD(P)H dehydrogenase (quinone)